MFRKTLIRAAAIAVLATPLAAQDVAPEITQPQAENPARVLLVGNSYLYYNDSLHNHLRRMVMAGTEVEPQYKSATIGGARLDHHNLDWLTGPGQIGVDEPFELVLLQGHSNAALSEKNQKRYMDAVVKAKELVEGRGGKIALYMPHAYVAPHNSADPENIRANERFYTEAGNEIDAIVIPVALAFEEAYKRRPDMALQQDYDGSHPTLLGTFLAAATAYATLYGADPVGNEYDYFGRVSAEDAAFLQEVARDTVNAYFGR
ncbi:hypothetical protein [Oceanicola sp. 502str15]|uniref:hypothetical protein n=1 Tax=Oceanicola sp. 502str15 TaxID=2696061 RepID=UPI002095142C|nr:hypothetical protein [Oceanicola sp. 502str15]MCO6382303.1 hypothetical protein [Oceanicola sp. 502str15]